MDANRLEVFALSAVDILLALKANFCTCSSDKHKPGTKTIGVKEDVYDRLKARKRDGESFTDLVDRLLDEAQTD
ncbi:antitoxin VapB family protein [Natronocalculus amylovorans]|uniref:Antitoxin VapB family protein n=1 Tax=Natronocalculus amylovorans TaxID=2917812 RepID=A0AAE3K8W0_9EURY|nr:antitoxin VapB family protein [Natronocalculus amylovorans]MCL9817453.1 antitoxin VapB family protein [Natronocalculus amylovorans]